jgi:hypothetical protein
MMNGLNYPAPLRSSVDHAARFAEAAADALRAIVASPLYDSTEMTEAERWLVGREDEVLVLVADVVGDWHLGAIDAADASRVIERYLAALHDGFAYVTSAERPSCCEPAASGTRRHVHSAVTRAAWQPSDSLIDGVMDRLAVAWRTPVTLTAATGHT